jgi:cytoskeleton protein RodZ
MQTDSATGIEETGRDEQAPDPRSPGKMLRASRKQRGLSKKEVADTLHITAHYVNALEHDQYDKLPGEIFAKGYMKRYAEIMALDQAEVLAAYAEVRASDTESASAAQAARSRSRNNRNKLWVGVSLLLFAGLFTGLWLWNKQDQSVTAESATNSAASVSGSDTATAANLAAGNGLAPLTEFVAPTDVRSTVEATAGVADNAAVDIADSAAVNVPPAIDASELQQAALSQAERQPQSLLDASSDAKLENSRPSEEEIAADARALQTEALAVTLSQPALPDTASKQTEVSSDSVISVVGPGTDTLRISFSGASWVEVNDGEENQIYRDLRVAGDVLEITGSAPFSILLGDAQLARPTFNGNEIDVSDNIRIDNSARLTVGL